MKLSVIITTIIAVIGNFQISRSQPCPGLLCNQDAVCPPPSHSIKAKCSDYDDDPVGCAANRDLPAVKKGDCVPGDYFTCTEEGAQPTDTCTYLTGDAVRANCGTYEALCRGKNECEYDARVNRCRAVSITGECVPAACAPECEE